jgi:hypothetical protein
MRRRLVAARNLQLVRELPEKIASPGPSTLDGIELFASVPFAPPGSPLDRYTVVHLSRGIRVKSKPYLENGWIQLRFRLFVNGY